MHEPVLLTEALEGLAIRPDGLYLDGTFGRGGHSRAILERLGPTGSLMALDRDPEAERAAQALSDPRFTFVRSAFSALGAVLSGRKTSGMLFDLGVSSPQLEDATRGFSFRRDGPLDMRMDPQSGESAAQWLARALRDQRIDQRRRHAGVAEAADHHRGAVGDISQRRLGASEGFVDHGQEIMPPRFSQVLRSHGRVTP